MKTVARRFATNLKVEKVSTHKKGAPKSRELTHARMKYIKPSVKIILASRLVPNIPERAPESLYVFRRRTMRSNIME